MQLTPHWFDDERHFWYEREQKDGGVTYILVDAEAGERRDAFDHARLADSLNQLTQADVDASHLNLTGLEFDLQADQLSFSFQGKRYRCELQTYKTQAVSGDDRGDGDGESLPNLSLARPRQSTNQETAIRFVNRLDETVSVFWIDNSRQRQPYGKIAAGESLQQHTFDGHVWMVGDEEGRPIEIFRADLSGRPAIIDRRIVNEESSSRSRVESGRDGRLRGRGNRSATSPDGRYSYRIEDGNLFLDSEDSEARQLTLDGTSEQPYGMVEWSPDSSTLITFRMEPGEREEVHLVESSPAAGGRAVLHTRPYTLPGDRFTSYSLHLIRVDDGTDLTPIEEAFDFGRPNVRWSTDGSVFRIEKIDRGHQRFRVFEVNLAKATSRTLIDEQTDTFIWTTHRDRLDDPLVTWLAETDEAIYQSERDGWRHLYLLNASHGELQRVTAGEFVVRDIEWIDEERRQIWFAASGMNENEDPYFIHHYRVNFDGSKLVSLTEGNGTHTVQYSPSRKFLIDTYSRIDQPPVHTLRRCSDGALVCSLEEADASPLIERGWQSPEVFHAKGRDGETEIWGIICRPRDFEPNRKYPVIEDIYAGPHGSHVPKAFSPYDRYRDLTELGFIVVKIDGMGTANRSKAFHDVCWQNLKDAGLPDRVLWHKAVAAKYPYYDLERVGIYGTSAGGQNSTAALLFHPDFYKVAVSACGCHDNRMDKASWNEQWMGYPVGPQYAASSNIDNAHRLEGKLLLIVGEMDTNVPPESTMRLVDALIKANKDFDLLVVPGAGHGMGGAYGARRMREFFVEHLDPQSTTSVSVRDVGRREASNAGERVAPLADDTVSGSSEDVNSSLPDAPPKMEAVLDRYRSDWGSLERYYSTRFSPVRHQRLERFLVAWQLELESLQRDENREELSGNEANQKVLLEMLRDIESKRRQIAQDDAAFQRVHAKFGFVEAILEWCEQRQRVRSFDSRTRAGQVAELADATAEIVEGLANSTSDEPAENAFGAFESSQRAEAAMVMKSVAEDLQRWFDFYDEYDPMFTWWVQTPHSRLQSNLSLIAAALEEQSEEQEDDNGEQGAIGTNRSVTIEGGDADEVSIDELLELEPSRMAPLIDEYQREQFRGRFGRRGRRGGNVEEAPTTEERLASMNRWLVRLDQLAYDSLSNVEQVDFHLLKHRVESDVKRLEFQQSGQGGGEMSVDDGSGIRGRMIGRDALMMELESEWIPYTPEELVQIAEREYQWCERELKQAANELGFGDDWHAAVEHVKYMHVEPGKQPELIRDLAWEAIDYLNEHELVTIPDLASHSWRMDMMSPERQLVNPFFTGGEVISVSFPTASMKHEDKLQSLRGNNIPFARATVHHELIPGHHLQGFMNARYRNYRRSFRTPFWTEGWALYWEFVLYDRGFPATPEDRIGFLVWRSHRCARIVFSLNFHLGRMTPRECVDLLVERVGFERKNAEAEVRRSVGPGYGPLYQAAYMLGGLQFRSLRREFVESGRLTEKQFHDAILRENGIPVTMVRAILKAEPLAKDQQFNWRFAEVDGHNGDPSSPTSSGDR